MAEASADLDKGSERFEGLDVVVLQNCGMSEPIPRSSLRWKTVGELEALRRVVAHDLRGKETRGMFYSKLKVPRYLGLQLSPKVLA